MNVKLIFSWALRITAALIMLQTLYYKFSASEESVFIFTELGLEPWGRIGIGIFELIASLLILYPRTTGFGALLAAGLMGGAIMAHITKLGIVVKDDGGLLFAYATIVMICSCILLYLYRSQLINLVVHIYAKYFKRAH